MTPSPAVDLFPAVQHTPCLFRLQDAKPVNGPPKTFQDAMDPLNKGTVQDAHSKSPYTKAGPLLGSQCPDLISRGNLSAIPATVPFIIQQTVF
ncbi:hypothetical protein TNCT_404441 [Trichonephila clavata]|uniref:Uncharacterized protein n=1 Tax=Trichonephila clavata TaxID=2740835 RepID=A0A8X6J5D7_TRICU|nr:hypothetical protein TNCT_404441 [Trichonephila clavata]